MGKASEFILQGKKNQGNLKQQSYINYAVLTGFILMGLWTLFLYPKTFIPTRLMLGIIFLPSFLLTVVYYTKILTICGYNNTLKGNMKYNIAIKFVVYILVTLPVGNLLMSIFLCSNFFFAEPKIQTHFIKPYDISESTSRKSNTTYSHAKIQFKGIEKQFDFGSLPVDSLSNGTIRLKVSKGLLGYYVVRARRVVYTNVQGW